MTMHNPPHPGEFIRAVYLAPFDISSRHLASRLGVSPSTLSRLLKGETGISIEMALRLARVLGPSAESWLARQNLYDLWVARETINLNDLLPLDAEAA